MLGGDNELLHLQVLARDERCPDRRNGSCVVKSPFWLKFVCSDGDAPANGDIQMGKRVDTA